MTYKLSRGNIEGALKLGMVPKYLAPTLQSLLDSMPSVDQIVIDTKVYDKDGKEIDVGDRLKSALMSFLLGSGAWK